MQQAYNHLNVSFIAWNIIIFYHNLTGPKVKDLEALVRSFSKNGKASKYIF